MHDHITANKLAFQACRFPVTLTTLNSENINTTNKSYIAKNINLPFSSSIVISDNRALALSAEEVSIVGTLEVQLGSELSIYTNSECP
jgi:hypothetical protein